jgi:hypothetical protein
MQGRKYEYGLPHTRSDVIIIPKEQIHLWPTAEKKTTYHHICLRHKTKNIEIGSLASPKILPIFADSLNLYKQLEEDSLSDVNKYMLIPNLKMLNLKILSHRLIQMI